jgi:energy-coupling factor transport system ATP-binding protein
LKNLQAIQIKNVTYTYPIADTPTLQKVNLEINHGEFVGLVGLTGSGKTTLFRLMNGLIPHYFNGELEGAVLVDGLNIQEHQIGELAMHVGTVFQEPDSQLFFQTVEDDVAFGPENLCVPSEEIVRTVNETLTKTWLNHLRYKSPNNLSEGQKQLVAISCVLAMKPKILLLDEPTAHLDCESSERVINLIKTLNREGITVVLATHEIDLLAECATRVVVLSEGCIQANGSPLEIFSNPDLLETLGLIPPQIPQLAKKLRGRGFDFEKSPMTVPDMFRWVVGRLDV